MAVKDGRLLEGPPGRGPLAGFETLIEQGSKASQRAQKRPFATPKRQGTAGQIVPWKGSWSWRRQLLNCLPAKKSSVVADASLSRAPPPAMATARVGGLQHT